MAVLSLAAGLGACGGAAQGPVVVRVGDGTIHRADVERWARAIGRSASVGGALRPPSGTQQQRALAYLISSEWLIHEAALRGVAPSRGGVSRALSERREANGEAEFEQGLRASGQTVADVERELEAELAAAAIRQGVANSARIAPSEVLSYYTRNRQTFVIPERRVTDLVEGLRSQAIAGTLVSRVGTGARFHSKALHEEVHPILAGESGTPKDIEAVTDAIFKARVGVASKPMSLNRHWTVFIVRKIIPPVPEPLAKARATILERLGAERSARAFAAFAGEYRRHWTAQTKCQPRYVVPGCVEYAGPLAPEDPFSGG